MSTTEQESAPCRVIDGDKLPPESGGADALCQAIATAVAAEAPGLNYSVEVKVLAKSRLSASVTTGDGRRLPEVGIASMDKPLTSGSFKRFGSAIARALAEAGVVKS